MSSNLWGQAVAESYDFTSAAMFAPEVLDPAVELLAELTNGGPVLEFAIGTGRVALPLRARGIDVRGIELSPHMAGQLRAKPEARLLPVTIGDMSTARAPGQFDLVYLVWNGLMNLTTQEAQVATFHNAYEHLVRGGRFVVEMIVPQLHRASPGEAARVFSIERDHVGVETFNDTVGQVSWSHHWMAVQGRLVYHSAPYRYVWPSELDLMGRLAGFELEDRWADWGKIPFTSGSENQVAVFRKG